MDLRHTPLELSVHLARQIRPEGNSLHVCPTISSSSYSNNTLMMLTGQCCSAIAPPPAPPAYLLHANPKYKWFKPPRISSFCKHRLVSWFACKRFSFHENKRGEFNNVMFCASYQETCNGTSW